MCGIHVSEFLLCCHAYVLFNTPLFGRKICRNLNVDFLRAYWFRILKQVGLFTGYFKFKTSNVLLTSPMNFELQKAPVLPSILPNFTYYSSRLSDPIVTFLLV